MENNYYQVDYANEVTKLNAEKQQLIKFLEDKSKEVTNSIHNQALDFSCGLRQGKFEAYQEVLDFIGDDKK